MNAMQTNRVLAEVYRERERQEQKCAMNGWTSCSDLRTPDGMRLAILGEEFGEVATTLIDDDGTPDDFADLIARRAELVQVAAVAVAWAEAVDRQLGELSQ